MNRVWLWIRSSSPERTRMYSARRGHLHVHQLLERQDGGPLLEERADVLERVDLVDDVVVVRVLADLLDAAVEVAQDRVHVHDLLARELQDQAQHAVRGGWCGPMLRNISPSPRV